MAALERPKRENAGSRMPKLIQDAEEEADQDDFYKTTYGGFEEEECDKDYESEEGGEDSFDSDFSLSEHDDDIESGDEEKKPAKKKIKLSNQLKKTPAAPAKPKLKKPPLEKIIQPVIPMDKQIRMRATTILKGSQAPKCKGSPIRRHPSMPQMRRLTQSELLAEAMITEVQNLAYLAKMMQFQEDKKNAKVTKVRYQGPIIRFQSVRMPTFEKDTGEENGYCSRSFLEFTDTKSFPQEYFPSKVKYPKKDVCVVTGLPAKYKDPLTGLPYATIEAFKYIRLHRKQLKEQLIAKQEIKKKRR